MCDLLVEVPQLKEGTKAECPRCGHTLCASPKDGMIRPLAISIAALVLLLLSNLFPFMTISAGGQEQMMTLFHGSLALHSGGDSVIAFIILACAVFIPAGVLIMIVWLVIELLIPERPPKAFPFLAKLVFKLIPWSMADVFLVGVLISLIKISSLAAVDMGPSFWIFVGFTILFTWALSSLDRILIWNTWERKSHAT